MYRKILRFPHPTLRKKAKAVKTIDREISRLIDDMIETMHSAPGVGLAAPQVGVSLRVIVADIYKGDGPIVIVNPKIITKKGKQTFKEGCLSLPGIEGPVERSAIITVKGKNRCGEMLTIEAAGLLATVLQHEIDHLEGFVFIDRIKDPSLIKQVTLEKEKREELI